MTRREVSIPCGTITLHGVLEVPDGLEDRAAGSVVCHPHPLFGGSMYNNVVDALVDALLPRGVICLRFNFRGAGQSQGSHGNGIDEVDDVRAALDFLQGVEEVNPDRIILCGYSFGCWVGLKAVRDDPRPRRLIGISPPVNEYDFAFLKEEKRPILLVAGDRDFVCSARGFGELVESIPEPKTGVTLAGGDHFHSGRERELIRETNAFLDVYPWQES